MKNVITYGLLVFTFITSFGQKVGLKNYKNQINPTLKETINLTLPSNKQKEVQDKLISSPKYKKREVYLEIPDSNTFKNIKTKNYKHNGPS